MVAIPAANRCIVGAMRRPTGAMIRVFGLGDPARVCAGLRRDGAKETPGDPVISPASPEGGNGKPVASRELSLAARGLMSSPSQGDRPLALAVSAAGALDAALLEHQGALAFGALELECVEQPLSSGKGGGEDTGESAGEGDGSEGGKSKDRPASDGPERGKSKDRPASDGAGTPGGDDA